MLTPPHFLRRVCAACAILGAGALTGPAASAQMVVLPALSAAPSVPAAASAPAQLSADTATENPAAQTALPATTTDENSAALRALEQVPGPALVIPGGQRLSTALINYGKSQGWEVIWDCQDWAAASTTTFPGGFFNASKALLDTLATNGADIHGQWWAGNKVLVVTGVKQNGVKE